MKKIITSFILLLLIIPAFTQVDFKKLDAYYTKALKDWDVPGMSIAIVKDGKIVFSKGYGVREAGKTESPDEHTLYAIASNSKAFTATMIGQLVDEGTLSWNDKVQTHLPYFQVYDPWVSAEANLRDILSHRIGLGTFSGDIVWYRSTLSAEQILHRVKYLPRDFDFRSGYGYSNVMYLAAGEVIKKITGRSWGENLQSRILNPLGMSRSIYTIRDLSKKGNYASPHRIVDGKHVPMAWEEWETIGAMGGIISSVHDMSQWMIFNLNNGIWKNDTLLSPSSRNMIWAVHNPFVVDHTRAERVTHFSGYALGWSVSDYRGKMRVGHTGGYSGMLSAVTMIPDENLGVVILTNGMKGIFTPLVNYTIDQFLKAPEKDWSSLALKRSREIKDTRIEDRKKARVAGTKPTLPLASYAGVYETPAYGKITVTSEGAVLRIKFEHTPDLEATLEHWQQDMFEIKWSHPEVLPWFTFGLVQFQLDTKATVESIHFDVPNDDFWFEELDAKKTTR